MFYPLLITFNHHSELLDSESQGELRIVRQKSQDHTGIVTLVLNSLCTHSYYILYSTVIRHSLKSRILCSDSNVFPSLLLTQLVKNYVGTRFTFPTEFHSIKHSKTKRFLRECIVLRIPTLFVLFTLIYLEIKNSSRVQNDYQLSQDVSIKNGSQGRHLNTSF